MRFRTKTSKGIRILNAYIQILNTERFEVNKMKKQYDLCCNIAQTLNIIGDKWTLLILHAVKEKKHTYKEIHESLPGIPTNLLSNRLKELCQDDLLQCELYSKHPPRYRYSLTVKSIDLDDIYNALIIWGDRHLDKSYKCISHDGCQGEIEIVYRCKECGEIINKEDLKIAPKE